MTKRCPKCGRDKALRFFGRDRTRRDGYAPACKACRRAVQAARYRQVAAAKRDYQRAYYAAHRADILAAQRARYQADLATARELKRLHGATRRKQDAWRTYQRDYQRELRQLARAGRGT